MGYRININGDFSRADLRFGSVKFDEVSASDLNQPTALGQQNAGSVATASMLRTDMDPVIADNKALPETVVTLSVNATERDDINDVLRPLVAMQRRCPFWASVWIPVTTRRWRPRPRTWARSSAGRRRRATRSGRCTGACSRNFSPSARAAPTTRSSPRTATTSSSPLGTPSPGTGLRARIPHRRPGSHVRAVLGRVPDRPAVPHRQRRTERGGAAAARARRVRGTD